MLFNSFHFLIFFPIVVIIYFLIPYKFRWILLLLGSYYFYMAWKPEYIVLLISVTAIDYFLSIRMGKEIDKSKRKKYLYIIIFSNLGLLFLFKYFNFFNDSIRSIFINFNIQYNIPDLSLLLPIGISFYTFQALGYTIDVYQGKIKPERHFGVFALYVSFFPQLVAGPIERAKRLIPQFYQKHEFDYIKVTDGLKRMAWGFFKKMVIADRIAVIVDTVYSNPTEYSGIQLIISTVFFAFQIYYDFSAYSDIAIGAAQVMGFQLMENFKRPYFSKSISEFWRRWHISLSSWFRDYLYIPLGGNRVSIPRNYFNLLITFIIVGIWHGANWTFIIWGALHGFYIIFERITSKIKVITIKKLRLQRVPVINKGLQIITTFILVCFAWIFFRSNSISDAIFIIRNLFKDLSNLKNIGYLVNSIEVLGLGRTELILMIILLVFMELIHLLERKKDIISYLNEKPLFFRWTCYYVLAFIIVFFQYSGGQQFIYFQF